MATENTGTAAPTTHEYRAEDIAGLENVLGTVSNAVSILYERAQTDGKVLDNKPDVPPEGVLQDCEFGMILLQSRDALRSWGMLPAALADEKGVQKFVVALLAKSAAKLLSREMEDVGGDDPNSPVFFTGYPYTRISGQNASANLDAAMLALGFFAPALKRYSDALRLEPVPDSIPKGQRSRLPDWVKSLRDLALYICKSGVEYAERCKVVRGKSFEGFSCDPHSLFANDKPYLPEFDRLFFTWTACETAHDLAEFANSLPDISRGDESGGIPEADLTALEASIVNLNDAVKDAAAWCESRFREPFLKLSRSVDIDAVVDAAETSEGFDPALEQQATQIGDYVQYAYHMSQYAAIRSLVPETLTIDEVNDICDRLDKLVRLDIMDSDLDRSKKPFLFKTLTRKYKLGLKNRPNNQEYPDDAYYPLVVRSMSGLLTRTMDRLGGQPKVSDVVNLFQKVLESHYANMIRRRAAGEAVLWSFAAGKEYTFYATQRTLFASLAYADFLECVHIWKNRVHSDAALEASIRLVLADKVLGTLFGPAIKDIVGIAKAQAGDGRGRDEPLLPKPAWAAKVVRDWLKELAEDFERNKLETYLLARAQVFLEARKWALEEPDASWDKTFKSNHQQARAQITDLMTKYRLTDSLLQPADLVPHFFRELMEVAQKSTVATDTERLPWERVIESATNTERLARTSRRKTTVREES